MDESKVYEATFRSKTLQLLLSATLADGTKLDGDRFFVNRVEVDEGLGRIPTAWVTLCSSSYDGNLRMDRLQELLGVNAGVRMDDVRPDNSIACTRWVSGVIVSVRHLGVLYSPRSVNGAADSGKCICGYRICIRPSLADLCFAKGNRHFVGATAEEVIATLLDSCCAGDWSIDAPDCRDALTAKRDFTQGDATDYAFLMRVLLSCGLTYNFVMPELDNGQPSAPKLFIFARVPSPSMVSPVRSDAPAMDGSLKVPLHYRTMAKEDTLGSMTEWCMARSVGVDACSVSYVDACGVRHSEEVSDGAVSSRILKMNHAPFAASSGDSDAIRRTLTNFLGAVNRNRATWTGVTDRLECRVGATICLSGFYGSLKPEDDIDSMLIAGTHLDLASETPDGLLDALGGQGSRLTVTLACVDISDERAVGRTLSPVPPGGASVTQDGRSRVVAAAVLGPGRESSDAAALEDLGQNPVSLQTPRVEIFQATVCDASGSVAAVNERAGLRKADDGSYSYEFYVKPEGTDVTNLVQSVRLVQTVGGLGQGLLRVPRIGDVVLVLHYQASGVSDDGVNYLFGYLPGRTMPQRQSWEGEFANPFDAMTLRFEQTEKAKCELSRTEGDVTSGDGEKTLLSALQDPQRFDAETCFRRDAEQNTFSELGFYSDHSSAVVGDASGEAERRGALANLQSTGDVQVSANDRVEINARNIHLSCPGWNVWRKTSVPGKTQNDWTTVDGKVEIDDISELVVNAKRRIVLKVAGSSLVIDKDGILLDSRRWPQAGDLPGVDASVAVCAMHGTNVSGNNVTIQGVVRTSLTDAVGGGISISSGLTSVTGAVIQQKTLAGKGPWTAMVMKPITAIESVVSLLRGGGATSDLKSSSKAISSQVNTTARKAFGLTAVTEADKLSDKTNTVIQVMNIISSIFCMIESITKNAVSAKNWESATDANDEYGVGDSFGILGLVTQLTVWTTLFFAISKVNMAGVPGGHFKKAKELFKTKKVSGFFKGIGAGGKGVSSMISDWGSQCTTVSLKTKGLYINAPEKSDFTVKLKQGNGPFAGKDADADSEKHKGEKELASFEAKKSEDGRDSSAAPAPAAGGGDAAPAPAAEVGDAAPPPTAG